MKINETVNGFTVTAREYIPEVSGTMYFLEHEKTGAKAVYLDRDERNMTFSIAFRTPPSDDTGVFHIIEHSVLCGSKKYPVKEPFVELLKGSLNTFLNALTYEDRTVYPVASRCEKDFLNLTDVYLDAVFNPKMLENENIFLQEGWHYEYDPDSDELSYNGVVYNEMQGAYSSPDEIGASRLRAALFPDTPYGFESGGDPRAIPSLTYQDFKTAHSTYYHPSNSMIFLDGRMDIEKTLGLIDSYLIRYEKRDMNIVFPIQKPVTPPEITVEYEPGGAPLGRVLLGYVYSRPDVRREDYALTLLELALTGSNDSPLKKALLDSGLCEDAIMSVSRTHQTQITIEVIGVKPERVSEIEPFVTESIKKIAESGIGRDRLEATIGNNEFKLRESDFGAFPSGVAYALSAYSYWNYGNSPVLGIEYEKLLAEARADIETDYYEQLLLSATVNNPHRATVIMLPKEGLEEEDAIALKTVLAEKKSSMPKEELEAIISRQNALKEWQSTQDSPENLNTLPILSLSDISYTKKELKTQRCEIDGVTTLSHGIDCKGIVYMTLSFAIEDMRDDELLPISILSLLLKNLKTESYGVTELQNEIKRSLGSFSLGPQPYPISDGSGSAKLSFTVSISALERNKDKIPKLLKEVLITTDFSDTEAIEKHIIQTRSAMEEMLTADSLSFALSRASSGTTESGRINELMSGYSAYQAICDGSPTADELKDILASLLRRIAVRDRLTVSVGGSLDEELVRSVISVFPSGEASGKRAKFTPGGVSDGIPIPAKISYATTSALSADAAKYIGPLRVARSILSYEYLWNEIRVKGGAYGAGFIVRKSGELGFYSYRDPSPEKSMKCYLRAPDYLRRLADSGEDITKFIIGAVGEYDILTTPRTLSAMAFVDYITGWTPDKESEIIPGMLGTGKEELYRCADIIESAMSCASVCVVGSEASLKKVCPKLSIIKKS